MSVSQSAVELPRSCAKEEQDAWEDLEVFSCSSFLLLGAGSHSLPPVRLWHDSTSLSPLCFLSLMKKALQYLRSSVPLYDNSLFTHLFLSWCLCILLGKDNFQLQKINMRGQLWCWWETVISVISLVLQCSNESTIPPSENSARMES